MKENIRIREEIKTFPSPYGVQGFYISEGIKKGRRCKVSVSLRSSGVLYEEKISLREREGEFPSPYGVQGFYIRGELSLSKKGNLVSVSLRSSGVLYATQKQGTIFGFPRFRLLTEFRGFI